ncbi:fatty acid hydroxylase [Wenyingzhuangia marina]|nr:fatty acid hydroxylase [Wenyingzhuangia marina]
MVSFKVHWYKNYFWGLIFISLVVWGLEIIFPWRKNQKIFRKDFWLDAFYMFFNFFIFSLIISGFYKLIGNIFKQYGVSIKSLTLIDIQNFSPIEQLLFFFVISDFFQWFTHVLLHRIPFLWKFHQIHHSVKEMGFAAHLRYHWMENILYKPLKTLAIMLLGGFEPEQAYIVHFIAITIGHINHANLKITWGPFKYVFNNPVMHLYHHSYELPKHKKYGMNYGISLSIWDYIFKTHYIPEVDKNLKLGFKGDNKIPNSFWKQLWVGFKN